MYTADQIDHMLGTDTQIKRNDQLRAELSDRASHTTAYQDAQMDSNVRRINGQMDSNVRRINGLRQIRDNERYNALDLKLRRRDAIEEAIAMTPDDTGRLSPGMLKFLNAERGIETVDNDVQDGQVIEGGWIGNSGNYGFVIARKGIDGAVTAEPHLFSREDIYGMASNRPDLYDAEKVKSMGRALQNSDGSYYPEARLLGLTNKYKESRGKLNKEVEDARYALYNGGIGGDRGWRGSDRIEQEKMRQEGYRFKNVFESVDNLFKNNPILQGKYGNTPEGIVDFAKKIYSGMYGDGSSVSEKPTTGPAVIEKALNDKTEKNKRAGVVHIGETAGTGDGLGSGFEGPDFKKQKQVAMNIERSGFKRNPNESDAQLIVRFNRANTNSYVSRTDVSDGNTVETKKDIDEKQKAINDAQTKLLEEAQRVNQLYQKYRADPENQAIEYLKQTDPDKYEDIDDNPAKYNTQIRNVARYLSKNNSFETKKDIADKQKAIDEKAKRVDQSRKKAIDLYGDLYKKAQEDAIIDAAGDVTYMQKQFAKLIRDRNISQKINLSKQFDLGNGFLRGAEISDFLSSVFGNGAGRHLFTDQDMGYIAAMN